MKKWIFAGAIVVVVAGLGIGGFLLYQRTQVTPEEAFRKYLTTGVKKTKFTQVEKYKGTGSSQSAKGLLDTKSKKMIISADLNCSANVSNTHVKLSSNVQLENGIAFLRLNTISGNIQTPNGTINLSTLYKNVTGKWYKNPEVDKSIRSMLDSGVFAFNSLVIAPSYDEKKIVDYILQHNVMEIQSSTDTGENYRLDIRVNRNAYSDFLGDIFPNLSSDDLILDSIFDDKSTTESTLTISKSGKYISEKLTSENLCPDIVQSFLGEEPAGLAKSLTGTNEPAEFKSIPAVKNSEPIDSIANDLSI
jgi:hypothetical protein